MGESIVSIISLNIWRSAPLDGGPDDSDSSLNLQNVDIADNFREQSLKNFFHIFGNITHIFALQEVTSRMLIIVKDALPTFCFITGWGKDCQEIICYNPSKIKLVRTGSWNIEATNSVTWAEFDSICLFCCHLTWQGSDSDLQSVNPRIKETKSILKEIDHLVKVKPTVFCGDFNDSFHPLRLSMKSGFTSVFSDLRLCQPRTYPTPSATAKDVDAMNEVTYDIIMQRNCTTISASVLDFHSRGIYPSDHFPVQCVLQTQKFSSKL